MSDTIFPHSPAMDSTPDNGDLKDVAEEALNAFFKVVGDRLDDWYPGTSTTGDVDPLELMQRESVALAWIKSHAINNAAVGAATEAQYEDDDE